MCRVLRVSRSGFYAWLDRPESPRVREDRELIVRVREIHRRSKRTYGSPRITEALETPERRWNHKRIERLMRENGIRAVHARKYRVTTKSDHDKPVVENVLARKFEASEPNQVWVADITYVPTDEGWIYLAAVLDLCSRRIVGWSMKARLTEDLVSDALRMALHQRRPGLGLLHHSDRGSQYAAADYRRLLQAHGIRCSMSRRGDCYDNAVMESFFSSVKSEVADRFDSCGEAKLELFDYIEVFYNQRRRHSTLGQISPAAFERGTAQVREGKDGTI
jgi:transposase InsO family protein